MKNKFKNENVNKNVGVAAYADPKGITLIALVFTIVILIILAGVAISLSLGENGIFSKAQQARQEYLNAQDYEETEIAKVVNEVDSIVDESTRYSNITFQVPNYTARTLIFKTQGKGDGYWITSETENYTAKSDGYIQVPNLGIRSKGHVQCYIDEIQIANLDNEAYNRYSLLFPIKKGSNFKMVTKCKDSGTYQVYYDAYFIPVQ